MCELTMLTHEGAKITEEIKLLFSRIKKEKSVVDVLEALPFMVFIKDRDGNITDCNKKFCQIMNKSREELLGQGWRKDSSVSKEQLDKYFLNDTKVFEKGEGAEILEFLPNGTPVLTYKNPLRVDNEIVAVVGISIDISNIVKNVKEKWNEFS